MSWTKRGMATAVATTVVIGVIVAVAIAVVLMLAGARRDARPGSATSAPSGRAPLVDPNDIVSGGVLVAVGDDRDPGHLAPTGPTPLEIAEPLRRRCLASVGKHGRASPEAGGSRGDGRRLGWSLDQQQAAGHDDGEHGHGRGQGTAAAGAPVRRGRDLHGRSHPFAQPLGRYLPQGFG